MTNSWNHLSSIMVCFRGVLEVCIRKKEPEMYKKLVDGVLAFSRGWMKIHNPKTQKAVTDLLSSAGIFHSHAGVPGLDESGDCRTFGTVCEYGQALCLRNSGKTTD